MTENASQSGFRQVMWLILLPLVGLATGVGITMLLNLSQDAYSNLIVNLVFLATVIGLPGIVKLSRQELGLGVIRGQMVQHVALSLVILALYFAFYLFVIRISAFKPFSSGIVWGLLTSLVVVFAEELYFRGLMYGFVKKRYSARTALVTTSLLFGLFHARQGLSGMVSRLFTGWLWGSVRYASGMIFLLIFPIHYAYNVIWLLFEGNWDNPPSWAIFALPALEFLLGLVIVAFSKRHAAERAS